MKHKFHYKKEFSSVSLIERMIFDYKNMDEYHKCMAHLFVCVARSTSDGIVVDKMILDSESDTFKAFLRNRKTNEEIEISILPEVISHVENGNLEEAICAQGKYLLEEF